MASAHVVGVLGGGQLGRMLAEAGHRLGVKVIALDPKGPASPTGLVAPGCVEGDFNNAAAVMRFAEGCDVLTVEIEHVNCDALEAVAAKGKVVHPAPATVRLIQDKYLQKQHFAHHHLALPEFAEVTSSQDVRECGHKFGYPLMLKAKKLAYDGRGNAVVHSEEGVENAIQALGNNDLYVERWVKFERELAVMVVRSLEGKVVAYPVVETRQKDNICHCVLAPATSRQAVQAAATRLACDAVACLEGAGIFGVELFELADGSVLLNEVAPRPHNSGHYTIEACATSQFEAHLRAILGMPLVGAEMVVGTSLMLNILGTGDASDAQALLKTTATVLGAAIHWYGKAEDKRGRKLGHITVVARDAAELSRRVGMLPSAEARCMVASKRPMVGVIMGSDSDLPTMQDAAQVLADMGVPYEVTIVSAHRTPDRMVQYAREAAGRGLHVIIAGAGGAAHLPGMVAAMTVLPVIGVPVKTSTLSGVDSLYSIVQMPRGVPVATVAIGNATNAGLLAVRMLASRDPTLQASLQQYQDDMRDDVVQRATRLEREGPAAYAASVSFREVK